MDTSPKVKVSVFLTDCGFPGAYGRKNRDRFMMEATNSSQEEQELKSGVPLIKSSPGDLAALDVATTEESDSSIPSSQDELKDLNTLEDHSSAQSITKSSQTETKWWKEPSIWIELMLAVMALIFGAIAARYSYLIFYH